MDIEKAIEDISLEIAKDQGVEVVDVEYVKEGTNMFLKVYIDNGSGIDLDSCELFSRALSKELDEKDPIKDFYFLEVSSPGLNRRLKKDKDFESSIGKDIEIGLFSKQDGKKQFMGKLLSFDKDFLEIESEEETIRIDRKNISKVNLFIDFNKEDK